MPEVTENAKNIKLLKIRKKCPLGATLWLDLLVAADNLDVERCRTLYGEMRSVIIEVSDLLKQIEAETTNG